MGGSSLINRKKLYAIILLAFLLTSFIILISFPPSNIAKASYYAPRVLGRTAEPTLNWNNPAKNRVWGNNYTANASGPITSFSAYVGYVNSTSMCKFVLYTLAGALVDYSEEYVLPNGFSGWVTLNPVVYGSIVSGTSYFIGFWSDNAVTFYYGLHSEPDPHYFYYSTNTFTYDSENPPDDPCTLSNIGGDKEQCIYVSFMDSNTFLSEFANNDFSDWSYKNGSNANPTVDNHVAIFNYGQNWWTKAAKWGFATQNLGYYAVDLSLDSLPTSGQAIAVFGIGLNSTYELDNRVWVEYNATQGKAVWGLWSEFTGVIVDSTSEVLANTMYQVQIKVETGELSHLYINGTEIMTNVGLFSGYDQIEIGGAASSYAGKVRVYHATLDNVAFIPMWSKPISVSLIAPTDLTTRVGRTVTFSYLPYVVGDSLVSSELWTNTTGSWATTASNSTLVLNNTINMITYTFSSDSCFQWNIEVHNTTGSAFALSNNLLTIYPMNPNGITVNGTELLDPDGNVFYLHGVNVGGFADTSVGLFAATGEAYKANITMWRELVVRQHMIDYALRGFNSIRVMFPYDWWINNSALTMNGDATDQGLRDSITNLTSIASDYSLYVVVSPWELVGYPSSGLQYDLPWNNTVMPNRSDFMEFWLNVDSYLGGYDNVLYDLWNEPQGDNAEWFAGVQYTINQLRGNGSEVPVIVQKGWCGDFNWIPLYPLYGSNILYSNHIYKFDTQWAGTFWTESSYSELYNALVSPGLGYDNAFGKKAVFIGEVGVLLNGNASHQAYWTNIIQILLDQDASFMAWCYDAPDSALSLVNNETYPWNLNWAGIVYVSMIGGSTTDYVKPIGGGSILPSVDVSSIWLFLFAGDFVGFFTALLVMAFSSLDLAVGVISMIFLVPLYIRTKSLMLICLVWLLLGSFLITVMPLVSGIAVLFMGLGIAGLLYRLFRPSHSY